MASIAFLSQTLRALVTKGGRRADGTDAKLGVWSIGAVEMVTDQKRLSVEGIKRFLKLVWVSPPVINAIGIKSQIAEVWNLLAVVGSNLITCQPARPYV